MGVASSGSFAVSPQDAGAGDQGKAHLSAGRYREAVEAFKQAIQLKADDAEAHNNLGLAYLDLNQLENAVASFKEAMRLKPDRAAPHNHLGILYLNTDRTEEAIQSFKEAVRLKPDWAEAQNNLGVSYLRSNRSLDAIDPLREAVRLKPSWAEPYNNLGVAYIKSGDRQRALEQHEILKSRNAELANRMQGIIETPGRIVVGGVLNGKAISLPRPNYPPVARSAHASGAVQVQVTIDEEGRVVEAKAISGHPLLQVEAVNAAREARFSPTKIEGMPDKVKGVIIYNFLP